MVKISIVKSVTGNGSFENQYGALQENGKKLLFSYEYEMEDGTILKANHKTVPAPFAQGDQVEYTITREHPEHGKSGKVSKPDTGNHQSTGGGAKKEDDYIIGVSTGHAVSGGIQLAIAEGDITIQNVEKHSKLVLALTTKMKAEHVSAPKPAESAPQPPVIAPEPIIEEATEEDDLPF